MDTIIVRRTTSKDVDQILQMIKVIDSEFFIIW